LLLGAHEKGQHTPRDTCRHSGLLSLPAWAQRSFALVRGLKRDAPWDSLSRVPIVDQHRLPTSFFLSAPRTTTQRHHYVHTAITATTTPSRHPHPTRRVRSNPLLLLPACRSPDFPFVVFPSAVPLSSSPPIPLSRALCVPFPPRRLLSNARRFLRVLFRARRP
jgi:hypothetical protein